MNKIVLTILFSVSFSLNGFAQTAAQIKANDIAYREYKVTLSRQLGVTCAECHDTANFSKSDKMSFKKAKEHIKIVQLLIDNGFDGENGHPKADCYMCHRGKLKPDYREPKDPMTSDKPLSKKLPAVKKVEKEEPEDAPAAHTPNSK